jgi:hypothetical protein
MNISPIVPSGNWAYTTLAGYRITDAEYRGPVITVTDTYSVLATDYVIVCNKSTSFTVTLPTASIGQMFVFKNIGAGAVTVDGAASDTIDGETTQYISQFDCLKIQCIAANTWSIV